MRQNILMHAVATACFYWLLLGLRQRQSVAMAATLLFAVHPLHVEPVAWMIGLTETQAAVFTLASLACFAWGQANRGVLLAIPAVFTKEGGMILPVLVFALEWWRTPEPAKDKARAAIRAAVPYAVIAAVYAVPARDLVRNAAARRTSSGDLEGFARLARLSPPRI